MKHLKKTVLLAMAAVIGSLLASGSASATTLEIGGVTQNGSVKIEASLKAGTSSLLKDTFGFSQNNCTTRLWGEARKAHSRVRP